MDKIKLWPLNNEFDITIEYHYTMNFPRLIVSPKGTDRSSDYSLMSYSIMDCLEELAKDFPESEFLQKVTKLTTV